MTYFRSQRPRKEKYGGIISSLNFGIHSLNTQNNITLIIPQYCENLEVQYLPYLKRKVA